MAKKVKWGIGDDEPEAASGEFNDYDGPVPPRGVYRVVLKKLWLTENKNGDQMIKGIAEIAGEKGEKKQYNGYAIWFNQNVTEQGAPYLKAFLDALGVSWNDFYNKTVVDDDEDNMGFPITKIGSKKIGANELRINAKRAEYPPKSGEFKLEPQRFLAAKEDDEDEDGDGDGDTEPDADETPAKGQAKGKKKDDDDEPPF